MGGVSTGAAPGETPVLIHNQNNEVTTLKIDLHAHVHRSTIYNSHATETTCVSISR